MALTYRRPAPGCEHSPIYLFQRATIAERQVESLKEQMLRLQGSLQQKDSSNQELDMAIDQMKRSNLELELTAKEKEVGL